MRRRPTRSRKLSSAAAARNRLLSRRRRARPAPVLVRAPLACALLAWAVLATGCGQEEDAGKDASAAAAGARGTPAAKEETPLAAICATDSLDPARLALAARWAGGHVRVSGVVRSGAGNTLNLSLSQAETFLFDEVFRGDRLSVLTLASDTVEATSVAYAPTPPEREAFARTGAEPRDPARPVCLDALLYEPGSLDLLAVRHLEVEGEASAKR